jgi:cytochrome c553
MKTIVKWLARIVGALALVAAIGFAWIEWASERALHRPYPVRAEQLGTLSAEARAAAPRRARILGCLDCHGEGLRGRRVFDIPGVAAIYAPNLTLLAAERTDQQLAQALRQGVAPDGRGLRVMPSRRFARLSDEEVAQMIAYIRSLPKGGAPTPPDEIRFQGRLGVVLGEFELEPDAIPRYLAKMPVDLGPGHAEARHLAATVCAECHGADLHGGVVEGDVKTPDLSIVGAYDLGAFTRLMRTGVGITGRDLGLMASTACDDFSVLTDEEIASLHAYLRARANHDAPP